MTGQLVSVIVPTHRRPDTLRQALVSIVAQRDVDVDVIVVDDVGDPATDRVVDDVGDDRVRVVRHQLGTSAAVSRNAGLAAARGEWIAFCDDDDLWAPDKLRSQLDALDGSGRVWSCTGAVTVAPDLRPIGHERFEARGPRTLRSWNLIPGGGSSVLAVTDVVRGLGGFDESLSNLEDWEMWIRLGDVSPVESVDRPLVAYRLWPGSKSSSVVGMRSSAHTILERHAAWPPTARVAYDLEWYVMWKLTNAGRRVHAARLSGRLAVRHGSARCAVRTGALLVSPAMVRWVDRRRRGRAVPAAWRREIDGWLHDLRSEVDSV